MHRALYLTATGPRTGKRAIAFAYVDSKIALDDVVEIDVRGKRLKAKVVTKHMRQDLPPYGRAEITK